MFGKIRALVKGSKSKKISPTITQPRQLKKTMEKMRSEFKQFAGTKAKTAKDRANIVRTKKSIERMKKLDKLQEKRKEGIKASKGVKDMIGRGEATKVGKSVFHKFVREKKAEGGSIRVKHPKGHPDTKVKKGDDYKGKTLKQKKKSARRFADTVQTIMAEKRSKTEGSFEKGGKVLKPVDKKKNPGLAKLPTQVRNKMGYMKDGGKVKKFGGGKK